jgi:hypothetical protein
LFLTGSIFTYLFHKKLKSGRGELVACQLHDRTLVHVDWLTWATTEVSLAYLKRPATQKIYVISNLGASCEFTVISAGLFLTAVMTLLQVIETTVVLSFLLTAAGAVRRLYFHPLAHIPGPKLAAVTWWYEFYFDGIRQGRFVFKIQELHKQYGRSLQGRHLSKWEHYC